MLRPSRPVAVAAICLSLLPGSAAWGADAEIRSLQRHVYRKEGLRFDSWNPHLRLNVGGHVEADF